jgi:DNA-binding transcriptional LysR family regulator
MNRTTRKLSLTEAGEAYYREVSQLLQQLDDLDETIADQTAEARGLLRISAPRNFGETNLAPALFQFIKDNPEVTLDLRFEDRFVDLVDEGIDVALRISAMPDSSLIARKIAQTRILVCAAPSLIKIFGTPKDVEDLRNLPCVIDTNLQGQANWRFVRDGAPISIHVSGPVRVNSPAAAMRAAVDGLGFALLPSYLADEMINAGKLMPILEALMPEAPSFQAVYPHRRHLSGKVRALIDYLVLWFEDNPVE